MGNKLGRRRQVLDERYTRPQGLHHHRDVDHKKLKKLILESKLAPCYPGDEECTCDLEGCPICFLYYPSLNRSRCCTKGICTECFLQMKVPNSARPTQCPFCKTSNYAVEYRGVKTKEEKGLEQIEEQQVIEAKIRMRQQELQDDEERMQKRQEQNSLSTNVEPMEINELSLNASTFPMAGDETVLSLDSSAGQVPKPLVPPIRPYRDDEFDLDLEDIMVMEAIWLSIQENGRQQPPSFVNVVPPGQYAAGDCYISQITPPIIGASSSSSPSGGLACAIASLAERQQMGGESPANPNPDGGSSYSMGIGTSRFYNRPDRDAENYLCAVSTNDIALNDRIALTMDDREWSVDHGSEVAEAGTSYASSNLTEDAGCISAVPPSDQINFNLHNIPEPILPESSEEQIMLAMAVSLAEARAMTSGPECFWK